MGKEKESPKYDDWQIITVLSIIKARVCRINGSIWTTINFLDPPLKKIN